jgi:hypothetical protein
VSRPRLQLQVAFGAADQQRALDAWAVDAPAPRAALVEAGLQPLLAPPDTHVERLPAGCVCCVANVPMRVALTRVLRARPASVLLLIADATHRGAVERMLTTAPLGDAVDFAMPKPGAS